MILLILRHPISMKYFILSCAAFSLLFTSCNKTVDHLIQKNIISKSQTSAPVTYIIKQGEHYADRNNFTSIETSTLAFVAKFDSSAIYTSKDAVNQYDINKLYGFSDNNAHHHSYSARFGWSWTDNHLHLYAYVYNEGIVTSKHLGTADLGKEINCSIRVDAGQYIFTVNGQSTSMPRKSTTEKAKGYLLYPYFGGDETAPHNVTIQITNL